MRQPITYFTAITLSMLALVASAHAATRVEMEIVFEPSLSANTAAQKWAKVLGDLRISDVRFRGLQNGDRVGVETQGSGETATYRVTAQLNSRGVLVTSGGQFTTADGTKLKKWLDDVRAGGALPGARKTVFGLTGKQFDETKRALAKPIGFSTKGLRPEKAIEKIAADIALPLSTEPAIQQALAADDPVRDELQGISLGTALAAIARTAGGVLVPRATAKGVELVIAKPQPSSDMWPIGWPPEEKDPTKVVPPLFEFVPVSIEEGVTAAEILDAIKPKLNVPLLFDHNNMARGRVDLKKPVKIPAGKTFYRRILDSALFQAGLKAEVRVDDAGKPLIWITTL